MELNVGTLEPAEGDPLVRGRRTRPTLSGNRASGGPNGGGNGGGGGGDNGGKRSGNEFDESDAIPRDKSRILTIFLLVVVLMTFGGLIGAYVVIATNRALEWRPFDLPLQVWISTILILTSSVTYELGRDSIARGEIARTRRWMVVTAAQVFDRAPCNGDETSSPRRQ